ncbi:rRNA maturation RNase YbeY [Candidatus Kuenenbacteria bacterium HGW-Kuenenbacteria-1]|uniref:Endoribonuclease YbeY n=1 Tax=Candidatus Kuenenbacteria bacterium HGW-Kuenenbacteria-1 TaxID=2013812 RepID=A0A2N1UNY2_9BACT|nr:MAG: rRNA maturation RNase YbeY [Candidatus Kuenenbacteria bacterium HGW-Kuenenbacteria-1]
MIEIYNQTKQKINKKAIEKIVQKIVQKIKFKEKIEVSIIFVGEKKIKQLNKQYRKINKATDVLSFGFWKLEKTQTNFGEIFIYYQKIKKQAKIFKHSISQELKIILIHSILHLLGYDHETEKDWGKMRKMEKKILIVTSNP